MRWFISINQDDIKWSNHKFDELDKYFEREIKYYTREGIRKTKLGISTFNHYLKEKDLIWMKHLISITIVFFAVILFFMMIKNTITVFVTS